MHRYGLNFSPHYKGSNLKSDLDSSDKRQSKLSDKLKNYNAWLNPKLCGNGEALKECHYFSLDLHFSKIGTINYRCANLIFKGYIVRSRIMLFKVNSVLKSLNLGLLAIHKMLL